MFSSLRKWRIILVAGPSRSGTTICGKMIAADTGHKYFDESAFHPQSMRKWMQLIRTENNAVIQCPLMTANLAFVEPVRDVLVVVMLRPKAQIGKSVERTKARLERKPLARIKAFLARKRLTVLGVRGRGGTPDAPPDYCFQASVFYTLWPHIKKMLPEERWREIPYDTLQNHPLWTARENRRTFHPKQTQKTFLDAAKRGWRSLFGAGRKF